MNDVETSKVSVGPEMPLTIRQIQQITGNGQVAILQWIKLGVDGIKLKAFRMGKKWKVYRYDLDAFFAALTAKSLGLEGSEQQSPEVTRRSKINARAEAAKARLKVRGVPISE